MRSQFTKVRFSKAELDDLKYRADAAGTTVSAMVRDAVVTPNRSTAAEAVERIRNDVQALQHNVERTSTALAEVLAIARELLVERNPQAMARIATAMKPRSSP